MTGTIDLSGSSPAGQPAKTPASSPLPEVISPPASSAPPALARLPPPHRPAAAATAATAARAATANIAPLALRWDPLAEQSKKARAPRTTEKAATGGGRKLTDFFGSAASGSGSKRVAEEEASEEVQSKRQSGLVRHPLPLLLAPLAVFLPLLLSLLLSRLRSSFAGILLLTRQGSRGPVQRSPPKQRKGPGSSRPSLLLLHRDGVQDLLEAMRLA